MSQYIALNNNYIRVIIQTETFDQASLNSRPRVADRY